MGSVVGSDSPATHSSHSPQGLDTQDLKQLRQILLGTDYQELLILKRQLDDPQQHSKKLAGIVSEALAIRTAQDDSLSTVLSPLVEGAMTQSIERDPQQLANALYPVMGPAIRKSLNEALTQTVDTFNQLLEQSLSPQSLLWRFDAWRSGRSYAEVVLLNTLDYQVEQVFLIHAETGLLLHHAVSAKAMSKDPDMVSGMLTAIQDFITDSFGISQGDTLKNMRLGQLTVLIERGPYAFIAAVVRGNAPADLPALLRKTQEDIHQQMGNALQQYQGDSTAFTDIRPLLEQCLLTRVQKRRLKQSINKDSAQQGEPQSTAKKWWLKYLLSGGLLAGLLFWGYQTYQNAALTQQAEAIETAREQKWQRLLVTLKTEPGVVVIEAYRSGDQRYIHGLADPLAQQPEVILSTLSSADSMKGTPETTLNFKPYLSAEPQIAFKRAQQILLPPPGVTLALNAGVLEVSGSASVFWQTKLQLVWSAIAGVSELDITNLQLTED